MTHARLALAVAITIGLGALAAPAFAQQDIDKVNGGITAEAGQRYGDLETVNGGIHLEDRAQLDGASTVNGGIEGGDDIRAHSLETVNGGIKLGKRVQVGSIETVNGSPTTSATSTAVSAWSAPKWAATSRPSPATSPSVPIRTSRAACGSRSPTTTASRWAGASSARRGS